MSQVSGHEQAPVGTPDGADERVHDAVVIGGGFGGVTAVIKLREAGFADVVALEQGPDVGGCWRENTYPGCACDIPSALYSLSFAPNANWSREYPQQAEIEQYIRDVVDRFGVRDAFRFDTAATGMSWDEAAQVWVVDTSGGRLRARFVISATGALHEPSIPAIPGLESFPGTIFHSARWDHAHDLRGERVAVVGSGASAIQFVPEIAKEAAGVSVFQRSAPWLLPRLDSEFPRWVQRLHEVAPPVRALHRGTVFLICEALGVTQRHPRWSWPVKRLARWQMERQIADPELRRRVTPDYAPGCKRILFSNGWYPALQRENVDLVTSGVREVRGGVVVASDGSEREVDTIILGTGFHVTDLPIAQVVRGRGGQTLAEAWQSGVVANMGTTVHGFPNLFLLVGPNVGLGHSSIVFVIEQQMRYVVDALRQMRAAGDGAVEVTAEGQAKWQRRVDEKLAGAVWATGGCGSYYLDATGRTAGIWPWNLPRMRMMFQRFDREHYRFTKQVPAHATTS